jgi:hypothetical protein
VAQEEVRVVTSDSQWFIRFASKAFMNRCEVGVSGRGGAGSRWGVVVLSSLRLLFWAHSWQPVTR